MKKKRFLIITLCFIVLTFIEIGIGIEIVWHGWGGFGDISLEYTEAGQKGTSALLFFIPSCVLIALLIHIALFLKKKGSVKNLCFDCICAILGMGITFGGLFLDNLYILYLEDNPFILLGRRVAWFFIECFDWMQLPIP